MKLHFLDRSSLDNRSISARVNSYPYFLKTWHYHSELELVYIKKSSGTRFIGDSIEKFDRGDLVLIGKNLPHMWLNDETYFKNESNLKAKAIALHFKTTFLGKDFFLIPEMLHISELFEKANYGILFRNISKKTLLSIQQIVNYNGVKRILKFIKLLNILSTHADYKLLASKGYVNTFKQNKNKKLNNIYEYIFKNFKNPITLKEMANIASMNPSAFSRFFTKIHRKPFSKYLNEIRIGYACKLLIENKYNITEVCYESGFNNLSNFNRQFKAIKNISPTKYLKHFKQK